MFGIAARSVISLIAATAVGVAAGVVASPESAAGAATTVASLEGESMTSVQGHGTSIRSDSKASGGRALRMSSAVSVRGQITLPGPATRFVVNMRTNVSRGGGASARVWIDGVAVATQAVTSTRWTAYTYGRSLSPGPHELRIDFLNPRKRNLFVDVAQFLAPSAPTPPPTSAPTPTVPFPDAETRSQAYVTGYSYWDNTPPGSATISNPVLHPEAAGAGTYSDPITVAVGHSIVGGRDTLDFPAGTRIYVPNLRRYLIVEDTCGDGNTPQNGPCHTGYPAGSTYWIDVWVGGGGVTSMQAEACMNAITGVHAVIRNPVSTYAVAPGEITGNCLQYGETLVPA